MKERLCTMCGIILNEKTAHPSVIRKGGGRCKLCHRKSMKATYDKNPEKAKRQARERRKNNPEIYRKYDHSIEGRHKVLRRTLTKEGSLELDLLWNVNFYRELLIDSVCHYCQGSLNSTGHGLDRKNNGVGHLAYNVVPCCKNCNSRKMADTTYEEMMLLAPVLREIRLRRERNKEVLSGHNKS